MTEYYLYYILSLFNKSKKVRDSQIIHIIQGKRTPSMFYLAEINNWHSIFETDKYFKKETLDKMIHLYEKNTLIEPLDDGYLLTEAGHEACKSYFNEHYYPNEITSFSNIKVRAQFWDRIQLFSQVFSELSYKNSKYIPVIKHPHHQENVRMLFQAFPGRRKDLLQEWIKEQSFILRLLDAQAADILMNQVSSHDYIGKTNAQLAKKLDMNKLEFNHYLNDVIETYILIIHKNHQALPITSSILKQMHEETQYGLSASTFQTYQLLKQGKTIPEIAQLRQIKINTVREHILEMAFVLMDFPYRQFIPEDIYMDIHNKFDSNPTLSYQELHQDNEEIEFMHYRLVELERMRKA